MNRLSFVLFVLFVSSFFIACGGEGVMDVSASNDRALLSNGEIMVMLSVWNQDVYIVEQAAVNLYKDGVLQKTGLVDDLEGAAPYEVGVIFKRLDFPAEYQIVIDDPQNWNGSLYHVSGETNVSLTYLDRHKSLYMSVTCFKQLYDHVYLETETQKIKMKSTGDYTWSGKITLSSPETLRATGTLDGVQYDPLPGECGCVSLDAGTYNVEVYTVPPDSGAYVLLTVTPQ